MTSDETSPSGTRVRIVSDGRSRTQVFIGQTDCAEHVVAIKWWHDASGNNLARAEVTFADVEVDVVGEMPPKAEPLIDPDCAADKHGSCVGGPCECECKCHDADLALTLGRDICQVWAQSPTTDELGRGAIAAAEALGWHR